MFVIQKSIADMIMKSRDLSKLQKVKVTDKNGKTRTVYKRTGEQPAEEKQKKPAEEKPADTKKYSVMLDKVKNGPEENALSVNGELLNKKDAVAYLESKVGVNNTTDDSKKVPEGGVTDSQSSEKVLNQYLGDKESGDRKREGSKEIIWGNDYSKKHKLEFKVHMSGAILGKPQMDQELFDELSDLGGDFNTQDVAKKYGIRGEELLGLIAKVKEDRVNIVESDVSNDPEKTETKEAPVKDSETKGNDTERIKDKLSSEDLQKVSHIEGDIGKLVIQQINGKLSQKDFESKVGEMNGQIEEIYKKYR